ncbi:MAG TPA: hypothetical protein VHO69_08460 [Phototrophicaceae bacterium]|nr:hypothetical protein [Phototrophicaceae bacterium]
MYRAYLPIILILVFGLSPKFSAQDFDTNVITIDGTITSMDWQPDGETLTVGGDKSIWFVNKDKTVLHHEFESVIDIAWHPSENSIAALYSNKVKIYDVSNWNIELEIPTDYDEGVYLYELMVSEPNPLFWSNDGNYITLIPQLRDTDLVVWDAQNGDEVFALEYLDDRILGVSWHPNLPYLAVGYINGRIDVWDITTQTMIYSFNKHSYSVAAISWNPKSKFVASAGIQLGGCGVGSLDGNSVFIWSTTNHELRHTLRTNQCSYTNPIAWNDDGSVLAFTTQSGGKQSDTYNTSIKLFDLALGEIKNQVTISENEASFVSELHWQPETNNLTYRKRLVMDDDNLTCVRQTIGILDNVGQEIIRLEATGRICGEI